MLMIVAISLTVALVVSSLESALRDTHPAVTRLGRALLGASSLTAGIAAFGTLVASGSPALDWPVSVAAQEVAPAEKTTEPSAASDAAPSAEADQSATPLTEVPPNDTASAALAPSTYRDIIDYDARPSWVESEFVEGDRWQRVAICSGPHQRKSDCRKQLLAELQQVLDDYIGEVTGSEQGAAVVQLEADALRKQVIKETYDEVVMSPTVGRMHQSHALIELDTKLRQVIEHRWHEAVARTRLTHGAVVAFGVLALLSLLFGYFKMDTATRGFYTVRLQFATAVAILAVIAVGVLLAKSLPWIAM